MDKQCQDIFSITVDMVVSRTNGLHDYQSSTADLDSKTRPTSINPGFSSERRSPVDHGHAWLIALAAGLSFFIAAGFIQSYTIVNGQLLMKFDQSATATALVGSLHGGIKMCSSKRLLN